jgi:hypothetical protein
MLYIIYYRSCRIADIKFGVKNTENRCAGIRIVNSVCVTHVQQQFMDKDIFEGSFI